MSTRWAKKPVISGVITLLSKGFFTPSVPIYEAIYTGKKAPFITSRGPTCLYYTCEYGFLAYSMHWSFCHSRKASTRPTDICQPGHLKKVGRLLLTMLAEKTWGVLRIMSLNDWDDIQGFSPKNGFKCRKKTSPLGIFSPQLPIELYVRPFKFGRGALYLTYENLSVIPLALG